MAPKCKAPIPVGSGTLQFDDEMALAFRTAARPEAAVHGTKGIPCSRHDPKIVWVDDAEIVGDRIAEVGPVAGNFFAQEAERRIGELGARCVGFVVRDVSMHEAP
jgi:hypothetical protein